jgi:hypothetical protein
MRQQQYKRKAEYATYSKDAYDGVESLDNISAGGMSSLTDNQPDTSLFGVSERLYDRMRLKMAFMLFVVFCIINSDAFAEQVLSTLSPKMYNAGLDKLTDYGVFTSGAILSAVYVILDLLETSNVL